MTFARAFETALNMETAHRDTQQLRKGDYNTASVHKVNQKQRHSPSAQTECYRCKGKNHSASECYFRNSKCHKCDNLGHIKACRASGPACDKKGAQRKSKQKVTGYVHAEETEVDMFSVFSVNDTGRQAFKINF